MGSELWNPSSESLEESYKNKYKLMLEESEKKVFKWLEALRWCSIRASFKNRRNKLSR